MNTLSYKLEEFEGPLDLLLFLISKNKLNINDIEISLLVDQYLEQIKELDGGDMETASEFLQMASRLIYLKTVSLLPKSEEAESLREELSLELMEYEKCKRLALALGKTSAGFNRYIKPAEDVEFDNTYEIIHTPDVLLKAYSEAVGRGQRRLPPPATVFTKIVAKKVVSVSSRVIHVLRNIWRGGKVKVMTLFEESQSRSELVATFLAVLELCKANRVIINGDGKDTEISAVKNERRKKGDE